MPSITHPCLNLTGGQWLRGNLHSHSRRSDGEREPQSVIDDYAGRRYGYLMLSDHDKFADAEWLATLASRWLILVPGNEITAKGPHMLQVGGTSLIEPVADRQAVIDAGLAQNSLIIVNHPNWFGKFNHCPQEVMAAWQGFHGLEIYNGVIGRLDGSQYATDHWDMLLSAGRRVWGYVNDDSHKAVGDTELGWNVTYVREPTAAGVIHALRHGEFYGSTGVEITEISVTGSRIRIATSNADRIIAVRDGQKRIKIVDGPVMELDYTDPIWKYVRFECLGHGERFAWTQPFWLTP